MLLVTLCFLVIDAIKNILNLNLNMRELPLEQKVDLHQVGDPIKRHTDLFKYGYISYV